MTSTCPTRLTWRRPRSIACTSFWPRGSRQASRRSAWSRSTGRAFNSSTPAPVAASTSINGASASPAGACAHSAICDYSYSRENYHPLGLRLFETHVRAPEIALRNIIEDTPRPRTSMAADASVPGTEEPQAALEPAAESEKERLLYAVAEEETNPYQWEFDLCSVTLGNFHYRKMSLVRNYEVLLANERAHRAFDAIFSQDPRPAQPPEVKPLALDDAYAIIPCDPTQASAIALARAGHDCIIQGPPGTGKSQTITNLVADCLARGKRVLFVCEKRAAIDVVFHRLQQTGLAELCCLIHDSQADKKTFVMDLKETYERHLERGEQPADDAQKRRREVLAAIHKEIAPLAQLDEAMRSVPRKPVCRRDVSSSADQSSTRRPNMPRPRTLRPTLSGTSTASGSNASRRRCASPTAQTSSHTIPCGGSKRAMPPWNGPPRRQRGPGRRRATARRTARPAGSAVIAGGGVRLIGISAAGPRPGCTAAFPCRT